MKRILKLNEISPVANKFLDAFEFSKEVENPHGIILRSFKMHDYPLNEKLVAVARAGAGVNNIPIDKCTEKGIVVFNTPGANANAVKELVLTALMTTSRKIFEAYDWTKTIKSEGESVPKLVENGKGAYVGPEIYGKKIGVVGLGAIGAMVANACVDLGMEVLGYDPFISVDSAWGLSTQVTHITDFNYLISNCDYLTLHIPLTSTTKEMISKETIAKMKQGVRIINCSRGELVSNVDILDAVAKGKVSAYFTDFPTSDLIGVENVYAIPHLGASTYEAEDNCAVAAAKELRDYILNGNIKNSVNFPGCTLPRSGEVRLTVVHKNVKNILSQLTTLIGGLNLNIENMTNASKGDYAYTIFDLDGDLAKGDKEQFEKIEGTIKVRVIR